MQNIVLLTNNSSSDVLNTWEEFIGFYNIKIESSLQNIEELKNSLIIVCSFIQIKSKSSFVKKMLENDNKILILQDIPELKDAQNWLFLGVHGYGNKKMSKSYLKSSIDSIKNGLIWIIPEITTQIIKNMTSFSDIKFEELLKELTKTEQEIALFLKDGYLNKQIADELNISINTVKTHIKNIYLKLGVNDKLSFRTLFS